MEFILLIVIAVLVLFVICFFIASKWIEVDKLYRMSEAENVKTTLEFNSFYKEIYNKYSSELKKINSMISIRELCLPLVFIIYIIIRLILVNYSERNVTNYIYSTTYMFIPELVFIVLAFICTQDNKRRNHALKNYKARVLTEFIKQINSDFIFIPDNIRDFGMKDLYLKSGLDNECDSLLQKNYIEGYLESGTFLKMCYIDTVKSTMANVEYFKGMFAVLMIKKDANINMRIVKNANKLFQKDGRLETDNALFEYYFDVYTGDRLKALKILTPEIMDNLVRFYEDFKMPFEIIIKNDTVYIRFFSGNIFKNALSESFLSRKDLYTCYSILNFIMIITKEIDKVVFDADLEEL